MDTILLLTYVPMLLLLGVAIYFTMVRKNAFEEHLTLYRPQHQLSQKREAYLKGVRKFRLWVMGIIIVVFIAPFFIYLVLIMQEGVEMLPFLFPNETIVAILIAFLVYYLLYYVLKRNEKALRMLLEQMSDSDFDLLLKVKNSMFILTRYSPPFVLCNKQLYFFIFYAIREIDPTKITDMNWGHNKNGFWVRIKSPKTTRVTIPPGAFPYLLQIIKKYNSKIS